MATAVGDERLPLMVGMEGPERHHHSHHGSLSVRSLVRVFFWSLAIFSVASVTARLFPRAVKGRVTQPAGASATQQQLSERKAPPAAVEISEEEGDGFSTQAPGVLGGGGMICMFVCI